MKIALYAPENEFTGNLEERLRKALPQDVLVQWKAGEAAPAKDIEALVGIGKLGREQMKSAPSLGFIQTASDGYDAVDVEAATELGIWVSYSPGDATGNADSVAEFAVLMLLAAARHLGEARAFVRDHSQPRPMLNEALIGKTVCILGYGSIGSRVADRLRPFGVHLVAVDQDPERVPKEVTARPASETHRALAHADAVVLCVRGAKDNEHMVNAEFLGAMKRGSILVNIARGSLVDEAALLEALKSGQVGAAGLDVTEKEPVDPKNPLLALPQVFITPHIAGFTEHTLQGTVEYVAKVMDCVREGKAVGSILNAPKSPRRPLEKEAK